MRIRLFVGLIAFAVLGRSQSQTAQRIGDLLIGVTSVTTPTAIGLIKSAPQADHYWVVTELTFRNVGHEVVCTRIRGSLKAEFGLTVSDNGTAPGGFGISELLPGKEVHESLDFSLKSGANPLELAVEAYFYGFTCGSQLPPSAVTKAAFTITGVSTPPPPTSVDPPSAPAPAAPSPSSAAAAYRIGGGVSAPVPVYQPEPEYSQEACKAKWQGSVLLSLVVDETGKAVGIHVTKSLGLGLDEKAVEAVQKWRFKPGMKDGKTTPVMASVEVNFHLPCTGR